MVHVVQVVRVVRIISPGDMHSGNVWFLWSKPSSYQEMFGCHACDGRTDRGGGKWKIGQCSVRPETAIALLFQLSCNGLMKRIVTPRTVLGLQTQGRGLPQLLPGKTGSLDLDILGSSLEPTKLTFGFRVLRWDS